jgi:hypothetical protein
MKTWKLGGRCASVFFKTALCVRLCAHTSLYSCTPHAARIGVNWAKSKPAKPRMPALPSKQEKQVTQAMQAMHGLCGLHSLHFWLRDSWIMKGTGLVKMSIRGDKRWEASLWHSRTYMQCAQMTRLQTASAACSCVWWMNGRMNHFRGLLDAAPHWHVRVNMQCLKPWPLNGVKRSFRL